MVSYQNKPLVSICVPTYNSGRFLKKSLNSIINQDYPNFEVIVSDNASTDDTEKIAKSFSSKVQFRRNPINIGCYNNCNECLKVARGDFVAFYHSNDIYEADIVRREVEFLQNYPKVGAVFSLDVLINENGKIIGRTDIPRELKGRNIYDFNEIYRALLKNGNSFLRTPTFMARRAIFEDIGLFNERDFRTSPDLEMWLRILEKYKIAILDDKLMYYRVDKKSGTMKYWKTRLNRSDYFLVMDKFSNSPALFNGIDDRLWKMYEYSKLRDDIQVARNMMKINEINKARAVIKNIFQIGFIRDSFRSQNGIKKLIIAICLLTSINIGLGKYLGKLLKLYENSSIDSN